MIKSSWGEWLRDVNDILIDLYNCMTDGEDIWDEHDDSIGRWDWRAQFNQGMSDEDAVIAWAKENVRWL
jgi:hypothetical protein